MITVTSSNGKKINLELVDGYVYASSGPVRFLASPASNGFHSSGKVAAAGNREIDVVLSGDDLVAANALFEQTFSAIANAQFAEDDAERKANLEATWALSDERRTRVAYINSKMGA